MNAQVLRRDVGVALAVVALGALLAVPLWQTSLDGDRSEWFLRMGWEVPALVSEAHLWFEEVIFVLAKPEERRDSQQERSLAKDVHAHLEAATKRVDVAIHGGEIDGETIAAISSDDIRSQLEDVQRLIADFRQLADRRAKDPRGEGAIDEPLDRVFDDKFAQILNACGDVRAALLPHLLVAQRARVATQILLVISLVALVIVGLLLRRRTVRQRRLKEELQLKHEFIRNMNHDLRTPLQPMMLHADLLLADGLDAKQRKSVLWIRRSAEYLLSLIEDILELSRLDAGKVEPRAEPLSIRELMRDVEETFKAKAAQKRLAFACRVESEVPDLIVSDAVRLERVLKNLVDNSVKFTDRGGVVVSVTIDAERPQDGRVWVRFAVTDTGMGFSREDKERLFAPFVQADASVTRRHGGSGLGLAISKHFVELLGGSIDAESEAGKGSQFWFIVPVQLPPESAHSTMGDQDHLAPAEDAGKARLQVLLAEDDPANRDAMVPALELLGCTVDAVENGREAVAATAARAYDLVLMDCQMPELDGYSAIAQIRSDPARRNMRIVALTAHAMKEEEAEALAAGADEFLTKPVGLSTLRRLLARSASVVAAAASGAIEPANIPAELAWFDPVQLRERVAAGGEQHLRDLAAKFVALAPTRVEVIRRGLEDAHRLDGAASVLGAADVARLCGRLKPPDKVLAQLEEEVRAACAALERYLKRSEDARPDRG